jgi:tetratricopeptide (TPR) repeat protein
MSLETVIGALLALQLLVTFSDAEITLHPVGASWKLETAGFTSETLTEMLQDNIQTIVLNSRGAHETAPEGIIERNLAEAIAEVLHLEAPIQAIRGLLGQVTYEVSTDFVHIGGNLFLETRIVTVPVGRTIHKRTAVDEDRILEAMYDAAKWVMRRVDPLSLARFELEEAHESERYASVLEYLRICRRFYDQEMYPVIDNLAGVTQLGQRDAEGAATFFRHALSRDPDFAEAELNLAIALAALGQLDDAEAILDKLSKPPLLNFWGDHDPVRASVLAIRGLIAAHEGRLVEAAGHMRKAVAMRPDLPALHQLLAYSLEDLGLVRLARFHVERFKHLIGKGGTPLSRARWDAEVLRGVLPPDTSGTQTRAMLGDDPEPASPRSVRQFAQVYP